MPPAQLATNAERAAISLASRIEAAWWRQPQAGSIHESRAGPQDP